MTNQFTHTRSTSATHPHGEERGLSVPCEAAAEQREDRHAQARQNHCLLGSTDLRLTQMREDAEEDFIPIHAALHIC